MVRCAHQPTIPSHNTDERSARSRKQAHYSAVHKLSGLLVVGRNDVADSDVLDPAVADHRPRGEALVDDDQGEGVPRVAVEPVGDRVLRGDDDVGALREQAALDVGPLVGHLELDGKPCPLLDLAVRLEDQLLAVGQHEHPTAISERLGHLRHDGRFSCAGRHDRERRPVAAEVVEDRVDGLALVRPEVHAIASKSARPINSV